jgi:hypothetical protein
MRVTVESAGTRRIVVSYDTDELPAAEAAVVRDAVSEISAAAPRGDPAEPDPAAYRVTIDDRHTYTVPAAAPAELTTPLCILLHGHP